jgi:putative ABC transport system ATP-binding protein
MTPLIDLAGIVRTYAGAEPVPVLRDIHLHIARGDSLALLGPSGSGKTTLLHIIGCLDRPDAGTYRLDGEDVGGLDDEALSTLRGARIGVVFQAFHLVPQMDLIDNVGLPLHYAGIAGPERRNRAREALARVGLGHRLHHRPSQLSGGEQQRCAIARAVVTRPSLLIGDEPTGNLDSRTGAAVMELFHALHRDDGITLVLVTHDAGVGAQMHRRVRMSDGRITAVEEG